ncbi:helical backbone metal receptor [Piscinibacterium candidicorallinum]|uniref:Helical backbone metal receptor n=1 Tax=Piscinibacterium candidicorallinum TaxID=1793872 RepID=A0ABV7H678_9BURK
MQDAPRIVSLVPSITELLIDLGLREHLVARTGFCIHPAEAVRDIPKVGGTKDVNLAKIRRLAPTHVIVNVDENRLPDVEALREFVPQVLVTHPQAPQDNPVLYREMATAFAGVPGVAQQAEALCARFDAALAALMAQRFAPRRVLYIIWQDPWMTVARDTYISRMLALVNWHTVPDVLGGEQGAARYPTVKFSDALMAQVDAVLLSSEPYRFGENHADALERQIGKPVLLIDGEMTSWYGSRAIAGLDYLGRFAREAAL